MYKTWSERVPALIDVGAVPTPEMSRHASLID